MILDELARSVLVEGHQVVCRHAATPTTEKYSSFKESRSWSQFIRPLKPMSEVKERLGLRADLGAWKSAPKNVRRWS